MHHRRRLAGAIERLLSEARSPWRGQSAKAPLHVETIRGAAPTLNELARVLVAPGPVGAEGLALVRNLLGRRDSPLFGDSAQELADSALEAVAALEDGRHF
jgi:hypothetical protein